MNWLRTLFRREASTAGTTPVDIKVGMSFDRVVRLVGTPRDDGVSGADILGRNTADPRVADVFLFFEKNPDFDFSLRFSGGKVVSVQQYPKRSSNKPSTRSSSSAGEQHPVIRELDAAVAALGKAAKSGLRTPDRPLRAAGISVLEFPKGKESNYKLHAAMLEELCSKGLLKEYSFWKVDLAGAPDLCGIIVISGAAAAIAGYVNKAYYLPEAEAFVASRCQNNWSKIDAAATSSDTPAPGCGIDVRGAEKALSSIRALVGANEDKIQPLASANAA